MTKNVTMDFIPQRILLSAGINCNKPGRHSVNFKVVFIPLCKEHYQLISKQEPES